GVATATFTTTAMQLSVGMHTITAVYSGDTGFGGSTSLALTQTVNQASTTTTITSAVPNPSTFGQLVTFTATVTPNINGVQPTGTVTFKDGLMTLGTGMLSNNGGTATATFTTMATQLGAGMHTVTAAYGG